MTPNQTPIGIKSEQNTLHVLHIEDSMDVALLVRTHLNMVPDVKCSITHCTTLAEGIKAYKDKQYFSVVLLDLSLPDSFDLKTVTTFIANCPEATVIVMTGNEQGSIGLESVKAGAQDFLIKGDYEGLIKSIRYAIERQSVLKRLSETQKLAQIGHFEFNIETQKLTVSDEVYHMIGLQKQKASSIDLKDFQDFIKFSKSDYEALKRLELEETGIYPVEIKRNEEVKFFEIRLLHTVNTSGYRVFHGYVQDITERKQTEELRKENILAIESARMREKFVASISHEMRTPLNAIYGLANLMAETKLNPEQGQYIHAIQQSSQLLLGIINDMLDVSALQYGDIKLEQNEIDLPVLLANLVGAMEFKKKEKPIVIKLAIDPKIPKKVNGDGLRLNQILYNLMGNAIKFTDHGDVTITASCVSPDDKNCRIQFSVKDSGIGIPKEQLPHIFDTFKRVETKGRLFEGAGLGLSIVKNLIELLNGSISVKSEAGKGTDFVFELPFHLEADQLSITATNAPIRKDTSSIEKAGSLRILIVEDNKMNMLVARKTIERLFAHVEIVEAEHGGVAIEALEKNRFSLILMDLQMPVIDGYEATKAIRTELSAPSNTTPIIAMTANAFVSKEQEDLYELGFDDYLLKPFQPEELAEKIRFRAVGVS